MGCPETAKKKKFQIGPHLSEVAQRILWRKKMKSAANVGWMSAGVTATTKLNTGKQRDHRKRPPMTLIDKWMGIIRINQRAPSDKKRAQRSWNYSKTQIRFLELTDLNGFGLQWWRSKSAWIHRQMSLKPPLVLIGSSDDSTGMKPCWQLIATRTKRHNQHAYIIQIYLLKKQTIKKNKNTIPHTGCNKMRKQKAPPGESL